MTAHQIQALSVLAGASTVALECGDSKQLLRFVPDNSIDSIVCDPPYELGFMGAKWDSTGIAYDVALWAECLRVLKPGGHLLAFSGSRTYHRMAVAIEDAGFEIRDQAMWLYGSGMAKSRNVAKYDMAPEDAAKWDGWGTAIKPAHEPICMARKPFKGTVAANMLRWGTGALNIEASRVPFAGAADEAETKGKNQHADNGVGTRGGSIFGDMGQQQRDNYNAPGRWPANVLHDGSDEVLAIFPESGGGHAPAQRGAGGISTSGHSGQEDLVDQRTEAGSAARFFYCAKTSSADRHDGLEHPGPQFKQGTTLRKVAVAEKGGNTHPTVKPTELMRHLCALVTPRGGVVLDPFMGSGSTGRGARLGGFRFIGFDLMPEHVAIAGKRIGAVDNGISEPATAFSAPEPVVESPAQLSLLEGVL